MPLPFRVITVSKGYSMWKNQHGARDFGIYSRMSTWTRSSSVFCWGAEFTAAWKVFLLKDFGGRTLQITASVWWRVGKLVFLLWIYSCMHLKMLMGKGFLKNAVPSVSSGKWCLNSPNASERSVFVSFPLCLILDQSAQSIVKHY